MKVRRANQEKACAAVLDETLEKVTQDGSGEGERMMVWRAGMMPRGISAAEGEMGVLKERWMAVRRIEENQGLMKVQDFGKHIGKTF